MQAYASMSMANVLMLVFYSYSYVQISFLALEMILFSLLAVGYQSLWLLVLNYYSNQVCFFDHVKIWKCDSCPAARSNFKINHKSEFLFNNSTQVDIQQFSQFLIPIDTNQFLSVLFTLKSSTNLSKYFFLNNLKNISIFWFIENL